MAQSVTRSDVAECLCQGLSRCFHPTHPISLIQEKGRRRRGQVAERERARPSGSPWAPGVKMVTEGPVSVAGTRDVGMSRAYWGNRSGREWFAASSWKLGRVLRRDMRLPGVRLAWGDGSQCAAARAPDRGGESAYRVCSADRRPSEGPHACLSLSPALFHLRPTRHWDSVLRVLSAGAREKTGCLQRGSSRGWCQV